MFDLENKSITIMRMALNFESFSRKLYASYHYKICVVHTGEGVWQIGSKFYPVKQGDIVILNNRQERVFREVSLIDGIELIIVEFEPQFVFNTPFHGLFVNRNEEFDCKISGDTEIIRLIKQMEQETQNQLINHRIIIGAKLIEVLSLIGRHYNIKGLENSKISEDMYKVLEYINVNYTSDISLDKAAHLLHMSITSFSKQFSRCMGMGFAQYVMSKRVSRAIHLLGRSNKTVLEISLDCGFNNPASFYKAFKKITNKTPGYYRNWKEDHYI